MVYLTKEENEELKRLLVEKDVIEDTLAMWKRSRIGGVSASMAHDGNVSFELLKAFDEIRKLIKEAGND